jgi:hypothetical protein
MAGIATFLRLGHLILSSLLGFGCIYLGYRLFHQIPSRITNDGKFRFPGIGEISFKAAPGIFFAAFGAFIMYCSLSRTISITGSDTLLNSPSNT